MPEKPGSAKAPQDAAGNGWRAMTEADLAAVAAIAAVVHTAFPEDVAVFAERLRLYPDGCLICDGAAGPVGYCISHPWRAGDPPALNSLLGALPVRPSTYYIHDLALLPVARGRDAAAQAVARLVAEAGAGRLPTLSLVAVNGSAGFWRRHGFRVVSMAPALADRLASYEAEAALMERPLG